jgi:hypothetical protein
MTYTAKYKICVSGAAETGHCGLDAYDKTKEQSNDETTCFVPTA